MLTTLPSGSIDARTSDSIALTGERWHLNTIVSLHKQVFEFYIRHVSIYSDIQLRLRVCLVNIQYSILWI